jgi:hypothetical protein
MRTKRTGKLVGNNIHPVQYRLIRFDRVGVSLPLGTAWALLDRLHLSTFIMSDDFIPVNCY